MKLFLLLMIFIGISSAAESGKFQRNKKKSIKPIMVDTKESPIVTTMTEAQQKFSDSIRIIVQKKRCREAEMEKELQQKKVEREEK